MTLTIDKPELFSVETMTCFKDEWLVTILTACSLQRMLWGGSEKTQIRQSPCPADASNFSQSLLPALNPGNHHQPPNKQNKSLKAVRRKYSSKFFVLCTFM